MLFISGLRSETIGRTYRILTAQILRRDNIQLNIIVLLVCLHRRY